MPLGNHVTMIPLDEMSRGQPGGNGGANSPPQNCMKLDIESFEYTINQLNNYFAEAERASCSTYCEGCLACLTGYLIYICTETHYEKCLRKVAKFISEQNDRVYRPRGLLLTDPTTRGLRLIEISVLDRPPS
ncbi:hypothetical protein G9C98_000921 [Cotesia typhae]|uniref:Ras modification protein ERF4 n=1 Tax=Cotesia typhae TaxID=2053667 RepID=A0A8J5UW89_9HYME|nr:hypothetical protein G9C98_000921 [Cotesia typhae]